MMTVTQSLYVSVGAVALFHSVTWSSLPSKDLTDALNTASGVSLTFRISNDGWQLSTVNLSLCPSSQRQSVVML